MQTPRLGVTDMSKQNLTTGSVSETEAVATAEKKLWTSSWEQGSRCIMSYNLNKEERYHRGLSTAAQGWDN